MGEEERLAGVQASGPNSWADVRAASRHRENGRDVGIGFSWVLLLMSWWMVISRVWGRLDSVLKLQTFLLSGHR